MPCPDLYRRTLPYALFPNILPFPFQINIFDPPLLIYKRVQQPADGTYDQGPQKGQPEALYLKPGDDTKSHLKKDGLML